MYSGELTIRLCIYYKLIHCTQHDTGRELDAASVCQQLGVQQWFYVSAKTGENVETAFECLIRQVSNQHCVGHTTHRVSILLLVEIWR